MQRRRTEAEIAEQGEKGIEEVGAPESKCAYDIEAVADGPARGRNEAVERTGRVSTSQRARNARVSRPMAHEQNLQFP